MLFATCPFCSSTLKILEEQMQSRDGFVRCGHCEKIFDANDHLINAPAQPAKKTEPAPTTNSEPPAEIEAIWENTPKPTRTKRRYAPYCLILVLVFAGQFIFFDYPWLLKNTSLRPTLDKLSSQFELAIPYYQNVDNIQVIYRKVNSHPEVKQALQLSIIIKNTANLQQAYPSVKFSLNGLNEQSVAQYLVLPSQYLAQKQLGSPFAKGATQLIELTFMEPGRRSVGFEIDFIETALPTHFPYIPLFQRLLGIIED